MKILTFISAIILTSFSAFAESPYFMPAGTSSASAKEGNFSMLKNPVFSDMPNHPLFAYQYMNSSENKDNNNHFAALNILGFSLIYGKYSNMYNSDKEDIEANGKFYQINKGFFLRNTFGFGGGFSIASNSINEWDNYRSWNCGFLLRPSSYLSIGLGIYDLNAQINKENLKRREDWSISIRPTNWFTLSADGERTKGDKFDKMKWTFSGSIILSSGVQISASGNTEENYTLGLSLPLFFRKSQPTQFTLATYQSAGNLPSYTSGEISINNKRNKKSKSLSESYGVIHINLSRQYSEQHQKGIFAQEETTFDELLRAIIRAKNDDSINSLFIEIDNISMGFGRLQELRDEILKFKTTNKKVNAFIKYNGNKEYYIASAADKIFFTPNSSFSLKGLSAEVYFFKELLNNVGVKYESIKYGKYKSFNETFTHNEMSPEFRENIQSLLFDLNEQFVKDIIIQRNLKREDIEAIFQSGIYSPNEAKMKGFIDEVMYKDEALATLPQKKIIIDIDSYIKEKDITENWGPIPEIAVIHVGGTIVSGKSNSTQFSNTTGDITYKKSLRKVFSDDNVKAVIIRINSGGGSAAASDYMWKELMIQKENSNKPVVFSFGDTAASGGYYIACTGDKIFANRATITGSIGVIAGKISTKELYKKLGINKDVVKMSEFADIFSESKELNKTERTILQKSVNFIYHRFTEKVMKARNLNPSEIAERAEGKVFTGKQAAKAKLTDNTGGIMAAIQYAVKKSGIKNNYHLIHLPEVEGSFSELILPNQTKVLSKNIKDILSTMEHYNIVKDNILYTTPYIIKIK